MKKLIPFVAMILLIVSGCSQEAILSEDLGENIVTPKQTENVSHHITLTRAESIADKCMGSTTRSKSGRTVDFVMSDGDTRALSDTVAYIFNYEDNGGFIMISSDDRVYPILATSETGNLAEKYSMRENTSSETLNTL